MNADSEGTGGATPDDVVGEPAGDTPDPSSDPAAEQADAGAADPPQDPADDLKAKFREALAHKHGNQGAAHTGHEDSGGGSHGHEQAHAPRMFRRKSG